MVLATHAAVGAGLATFFPTHPEVAFVVGFTSHFLLDSIPHWDYSLAASHSDPHDKMKNTLVFTSENLFDFVKIGTDILIGFLVAYLLFGNHVLGLSLFSLACGAIGAIVPDGLQFLYYRWGGRVLTTLQRFHQWIHASSDLNNRPMAGVFFQCMVVTLVAVIVHSI